MRARIKKNDTVMVIAGRERGKTGKVLRVDTGEGAGAHRAAQPRQAPSEAARRPSRRPASSRRKRRFTSRTS
jgi:hypothetical protein